MTLGERWVSIFGVEVLNEFAQSSEDLTDKGAVSVIVPIDTVCTVVFVVMVGVSAGNYLTEQRVDTDVQAGPDRISVTAMTTVPY